MPDGISHVSGRAAARERANLAARFCPAPKRRRWIARRPPIRSPGSIGRDAGCTLRALGAFTNRLSFATGVSACAVGDCAPAVGAAAGHEWTGRSSLTYVWTLDREASMRRDIAAGARAIFTNRPRTLAEVARGRGKTLARPETPLPAVTSRTVLGDARCE